MAKMNRRSLLAALAAAPGLSLAAHAQAGPPDASAFFRLPQMTGAQLSPDGQRLAMSSVVEPGRVALIVLDLATMKPTVAFASALADVGRFVWVNSKRLAFTLTERGTPDGKVDAAPGLFAVDADGAAYRQLVERQRVFVRNGNDGSSFEPWNTFLWDGFTPGGDDEVLVWRPEAYGEKDWGYIKLHRLNTRTGRSNALQSPLHGVDWWFDAQGALRVMQTREGRKGAVRWRASEGAEWRTLTEYEVYTGDGDLRVGGLAADGRLYVSARRGGDKLAMWLLDPQTGLWSDKPVAQSPGFDLAARVIRRQDQVLGLRFKLDAEVTQWLDEGMRVLQAQIDKVLPRTVNRLSVAAAGDAPWVLIEAFSDAQPELYFLFNRETRKFTRLGAARPDIDAKAMASMDMQRIKASDGRELPLWLTLPPGAQVQKNLPMVVLVHGGPFVRAPDWHWDAEVQFLAARGYAVLQPQFRGTQGFGAEHYRAGWRQWGKAMQSDLADATRWAIAQGLADPGRIAIAGASYGGYATLMGLVRNPELFRCGVAWVGVTDLDMMHTVSWDDISADYKKHGMPQLLGDRVKDAADLKENSPVTHAARITQPLLLAYGEQDRRVPLVHGETFRRAVKAHNHQLEWIEYPDEGHGWRAPATQVDFWNRVARFLDKHLAAKAP